MTFARVLGESGLTKVELARLYGVSRQTIHYWAKVGPPREGTYTARMAATITKALLSAVEKRVLPLSAMDAGVRRARIARMAVTLGNLKPSPMKGRT